MDISLKPTDPSMLCALERKLFLPQRPQRGKKEENMKKAEQLQEQNSFWWLYFFDRVHDFAGRT